MLGNLLDNACKWARTTVRVSATNTDRGLGIEVEDDGPGLGEAARSAVLSRGVRMDETVPGSGLGLAIVKELAQLYGGQMQLHSSTLGGLRVTLNLPSVA